MPMLATWEIELGSRLVTQHGGVQVNPSARPAYSACRFEKVRKGKGSDTVSSHATPNIDSTVSLSDQLQPAR